MESFFKEDTYDTLEGKRWLADRLSLGSRLVFTVSYIAEIMRARSLAIKNKYDVIAWANSSYRIFNIIEGCGGRFQIRGLSHIRESKKKSVVFISNHMSTLETFVFPCIILP